jgi:hypothetical protein
MKVLALPFAIASVAVVLATSVTVMRGPAAAATTKQSNPIVVKATVTQPGCKVISPGGSTTYYQKGQSVIVTPSFPSFTLDSSGTVGGNPSIVEVVIQCSPGYTVTGTLTTTNFPFQGNLSSIETFIASGAATATLDCSTLGKQKIAVAAGTAPTTGNSTPMVYLWYGACAATKNNWQPGTYSVSDPITVTFN